METMTNQSEKIVISKEEEGLTVEEYLKKKFDEMILVIKIYLSFS